jgi:hypothetical protein
MFPLVAIGGAIGAVMSIAKGAEWLSDQIREKDAASAGGKSGATKLTDAQAASFAATLAAQTAGQSVPASTAISAPTMAPMQATGPDENAAARAKAGVLAYSHIGEHHGHRAGAIKRPGSEGSVAGA